MDTLEISRILHEIKIIAVVGLSPKEDRPSNQVASYLLAAGYTIIPVNPGQDSILGLKCYPSLTAIPDSIGPIDVVDIFRRPQDVLPIVEEAIAVKAKIVWMQEGIVNEVAAAKAREAGLKVFMDRCLKVAHMDLMAE